jgi:hypothetical protein
MQCVQASSSVLLVVAEEDLAEVGVVNILGVAGHAGPCALGSAVVLVVELLEQSAHGLLRQVCGKCNLLHAPDKRHHKRAQVREARHQTLLVPTWRVTHGLLAGLLPRIAQRPAVCTRVRIPALDCSLEGTPLVRGRSR